MRETGSEIFISAPVARETSAPTLETDTGNVGEDAGEAVPEEVIITVNVSDWDPDKDEATVDQGRRTYRRKRKPVRNL